MNSQMSGLLGIYGLAIASIMSDDFKGVYSHKERRVSCENLSDSKKLALKNYHDKLKINAKNKHLKQFEIAGEIYYGSNYESAYKKYKKSCQK